MDETSWQHDMVSADADETKHTVRLAKGLAAHNIRELTDGFQLGENDVICGRGRKCFQHTGNQKFRKLVADLLPKYHESPSKLTKSFIICDIVNQVLESSATGGFVKKDPVTGKFFEVGDFLAREKTSQAFRDALHDQYKSSTAGKKKCRLQEHIGDLHRQSSVPNFSSCNARNVHELTRSSSLHSCRSPSSCDDGDSSLANSSLGNLATEMSVNRPVFNFGASKCESDNADCIRIFSTSSKLRDLYAKKSNWNDDIFDKPRCCDFQNMKMSNRLQKRPSAPELTLRSLLKNPQGEKLSEAEMKNHFEPNGINFQQRANQQPNSDLLGGNFAQMSTFRPDKRHSIICGRDLILSMRSIVDEFRGSCSTPMANVSFPSAYSEECSLPSTLGFSGCLHSEPQTYGSANIVNALTSHSGGSDLTFHSVAIKLEEQAFFQRDSNNLDDFEPRPMTPTTLGIDGCNVDISPIGDGTTEGLNVMLQTFRVSQYNDIEDDLFAPIPL